MSKSDALFLTLVAALVAAGIWLVVTFVPQSAPTPAQTTPEVKPATKTRCDFTGLMSSNIVAEEASNGYEFAGRISAFLCGENGLSFRLRANTNPNPQGDSDAQRH